ncbi:MAG TPA: hypothetical protein EYN66_21575 [Myxococcales bacterium]|nr:hypothetical protein [Myxococcales bacterium]
MAFTSNRALTIPVRVLATADEMGQVVQIDELHVIWISGREGCQVRLALELEQGSTERISTAGTLGIASLLSRFPGREDLPGRVRKALTEGVYGGFSHVWFFFLSFCSWTDSSGPSARTGGLEWEVFLSGFNRRLPAT